MTSATKALVDSKASDAKMDTKTEKVPYDDVPLEEYKQPLKSRILDVIMVSTFFCGVTMMILYAPNFHSRKTLSDSWMPKKILHAASRLTPEQLHLSLGADSSEMYLTWSSLDPVEHAEVTYCRAGASRCIGQEQRVVAKRFDTRVFEGDLDWTQVTSSKSRLLYTYRAKMEHLADGLYIYRAVSKVDSETEYHSPTYEFWAQDLARNTKASYSIAMYGDLGLINGQSVPRLISDVEKDEYDVIIHNGDFAYDLDSQNGRIGDQFMRMIEPIAARVPYQVSVGNHEVAQNFTHYDSRFTMINSATSSRGSNNRNNFYYSFDVGPIHFIAFSTEFYYFSGKVGLTALHNQYEWLKEDLAKASSPSERAKRPWIIVFGHRPMYCSSSDPYSDCSKQDDSNILRKGLPPTNSYGLEKLFYDHGVDVEFYSHEHQYERFLPIYDGQLYPGTDNPEDPYLNPSAPVHIISGSAGCSERLDPFERQPVKGSVRRISDYGYTRLRASCSTLRFEQISDDNDGSIVDQFEIIKTRQNFPQSQAGQGFEC